ncbi:MAG: DUF1287 domain-containing protein [Verrucomicrobiales bacterium]|nr:DUF1287 domain-containing protein [Verrucomicrobiales bacterium]
MKYFSLVLFGVWVLAEMLSAQDSRAIASPETFAGRLVEAANFRTTQSVRYDPAYVVIDYPNGDVPADTGVCSDVIVRSYRALGIDLQKRLHEDMKYNFSSYPKNWGLTRPDKNIDHRRVPNLQRFFKRKGAEVAEGGQTGYLPGDLVAWDLTGNGLWHIGVVTGKDEFVHNIGSGPVKERGIGQWEVVGHYRYHPEK